MPRLPLTEKKPSSSTLLLVRSGNTWRIRASTSRDGLESPPSAKAGDFPSSNWKPYAYWTVSRFFGSEKKSTFPPVAARTESAIIAW